MKILLTGSSGFMGTHLLPLLKNYDVVLWDKKDGNDIFSEKFEEAVNNCAVVIHLAAMTDVEKSKRDSEPFYMVNVFGTARVAYLCCKYKKKLIYLSTVQILKPHVAPYADSKYHAEQIVKIASKFTPTVILRIYNVFGSGMHNNIGSIINLFLKN